MKKNLRKLSLSRETLRTLGTGVTGAGIKPAPIETMPVAMWPPAMRCLMP